jgi:hypothetical protein
VLFCLSLLCPIGAPSYTERKKDWCLMLCVCVCCCNRSRLKVASGDEFALSEANFVCVLVLIVLLRPMIPEQFSWSAVVAWSSFLRSAHRGVSNSRCTLCAVVVGMRN